MEQLFDTASVQGLPPLVIWFILFWIVTFGASVGSFMNVVIYRLPIEMSIVHPASRCPVCGHAIRAWDNVPVVGWLVLRGRCRDCDTRISARYPAVEALVAALFLCLAIAEPLSGGRCLPLREQSTPPSLLWPLFGAHVTLMCTLICASMIQIDRKQIPLRLFIPSLVVALLVRAYWSEYRNWPGADDIAPVGWVTGVANGLLAFLVASICGLPRALAYRPPRLQNEVAATVVAFGATAIALGLLPLIAIALATAMIQLVVTLIARVTRATLSSGWFAYQTIVTLILMLSWRFTDDRLSSLGRGYSSIIVIVILVSVLSLLTGWLSHDPRTEADQQV